MIGFDWPWLLLSTPLPWLIYRFLPPVSRQEAALRVPFYSRIAEQGSNPSDSASARRLPATLLCICWLCAVLAAAQPIWIGDPVDLPTTGRDLMLAVDISGSMELEDMQLNNNPVQRITLVKNVVADFVDRRQGDRLGMILFGTQAYLQTPLTFDRVSVNTLLQEAQIGFAGEKTAIGDAIGLSVKRLRQRPQQSRVLILLTDGENTAGEVTPLKAADLAAQENIKIYTIGIGAEEMIQPGLFGSRFGSRRFNPSANLDETTLTAIAEKTGGRYFRARNQQELEQIYVELDTLEPIEQETERFRPIKSLLHWPLGIAFFASLLLGLRALPRPQKSVSTTLSNKPSGKDPNQMASHVGRAKS